jgi:hypothetical protein
MILVNTGMYDESLVELLTMKFHENSVVLELLHVGRQAGRQRDWAAESRFGHQ